jgi:hypothetical protein
MNIADQLQAKLPRGYKTKLAERNGVAKSMVTYVFKNNKTEHPIFQDAIKMAEEYQATQQDISEKINAI